MFALAACGGGGDDGDGDGNGGRGGVSSDDTSKAGDGGDTGEGQDPNRVDGPVTIDGATEGGTVTVLSNAGLNTMDPSEAYYQNTTSILTSLVTRQLTQYVYDEESETMILIPDLATSLGEPSDDFKTWTFELKDGIKYEDGTPVKPEDFVYAAARSMDRTQFPEGPAYSNDFFKGGSTYEGPFTGKGLDGFDAVTVEGNKLTYHMDTPFPDLPYWLSFAAMGPIPEKQGSDPAAYALHPLATGPYKFADYTPEKALTLVRNDQWDPNSDPGRTAYPDSYNFKLQEASEKIDELMVGDKGDAQTTLTYDDVLSANYRDMNESGRLVVGSFPLTSYWGMDYRKITDLKVRQALAYAFPYADFYRATGLIDGVTAIPGSTLMPPGTPGRVEFNPIPDHEIGTTDTDKAKQLLEEAGAVGFEIKWPYANDDEQAVAGKNAIVASLEKAGFKASPLPTTVAELSTVRADPDADINVRPAGWIADWPSGGSWFPPVIQSTNLQKEGLGSNYSVFNEPAIDQKIKDILQMDVEEQPAAWGALDEEVMTDYLPLFVTRYGGVAQQHGSKIMGHYIDNTIGMPTWKNIYVAQ
ncbi:ABC transporter substrate-binding protein [Nocardioides sp. GXZ039]|uniref:ABC transporter substrate-binding protein n=1 Tax=Nocardioides sp. GXZ039 TaxID=3136018 RepID=UPI0030F39B9C